jgi:hypothetical protein
MNQPYTLNRLDSTFLSLAQNAWAIDDKDWGSERQIDAENELYEFLDATTIDVESDKVQNYTIHATSEEIIKYAVSLYNEIHNRSITFNPITLN